MNQKLDAARAELAKFSTPSEAKQALALIRKKLEHEKFVKYWSATERQAELFEKFTSDAKVFIIRGGNRSGKTEIGAFITMAWALGKDYFIDEPAWEYVKDLPIPPPPCNIWVVGLDFPTLRDVIWREKLRYGRQHPGLIPAAELQKPPNDSDFQLFFKNGSVITGKSADSGREKFQGASVDFIWIDEEPESDVYNECYQRTVDCKGKILVTLTPLVDIASGVREPWVYDLCEAAQKGEAKDVRFVQLSVLDNPYVPDEEKAKLLEKWAGHPEERARLYGEFVQRSGLVYNLWSPSCHLVTPFKIPADWRRIVSIDPAATGVTAALWAAVQPGTNDVYLYKEYYEKDKVVSDHAKNILIRNAGDQVDIWLLDPKWASQRNNETHKTGLQLYRDSKVPVRSAEVGEDYGVNVSMQYVAATTEPTAKHPKLYVFKGLSNFRYEIEHYTWAFFSKGEMQGLSKEKPIKRHDHLMNAMQYLLALKPKGLSNSSPVLSPEERKKYASLNSYT